jgi:hypothetical protein
LESNVNVNVRLFGLFASMAPGAEGGETVAVLQAVLRARLL